MVIDGYCTLGVDREYDLTDGELLVAMDRAGVDRAVIAPVDRCMAVDNREGNDLLLKAAAGHPDRLIPACSANPWYGSRAVAEAKRAVDGGARVLVLHPFVQGYLADDELVWPLLDAAREEKVPVYIHTGPPGNATPWHVTNLAERYADVDFLMGHCGSTDFKIDMVEAARAACNVYCESSLARPFGFVDDLRRVGWDRGIMSSFSPVNDLEFEWVQMRAFLPPEAEGAVCGGNLCRLLEKRGAL